MGFRRSAANERKARARLEEERRQRDLDPERRFEYHVLRVGLKARADPQLNELGAKGWQLVQVVETDGHLALYLEREIPVLPADAAVPTETN